MRYKVTKTNNGYLVKDTHTGKVVSIHKHEEDAEDTMECLNDAAMEREHERKQSYR